MEKESINAAYDVPESFYQAMKPYLKGGVFENGDELVGVWQQALAYRRAFPEYDQAIAEIVFSTEASSELISDNDLYEAVHAQLGALEVRSKSETDQHRENAWKEIEQLVAEARSKLQSS